MKIIDETLTPNADSSATGSGWGVHGLPIVRLANGDLWTTWLENGQPGPRVDYTHPVVIAKNGVEQYRNTTGTKEKALLFADGDGIVADFWSAGTPWEWSSKTGTITQIPGDWYGLDGSGNNVAMDYPYAAGGTLADGRRLLTRLGLPPGSNPQTPTTPCYLEWAVKEMDGSWSPVRKAVLPEARIAYMMLHAKGNGLVGRATRDALWPDLGFTPANPLFNYCFNRVVKVDWPDVTQPPVVTTLAEEAPTNGDFNVYYTCIDFMVDSQGREHTLCYSQTDGISRLDHFIGDTLTEVIPIRYQNMSRMIELGGGLVTFSVYLDNVYFADGSSLPFDKGYQYVSDHPYVVNTRNGSILKPAKMDVVQLNGGHFWQHWMLESDGSPHPPPPVPTPSPVPLDRTITWKLEGKNLVTYIGTTVVHRFALNVADQTRLKKAGY